MPILGAGLRAELADAVGVKSLRAELRALAREMAGLRSVIRGFQARAGRNRREPSSSVITPAQIRAARQRLGESREAFATRLQVSRGIIFQWETGRSTPRRAAIVQRLQQLLGAAPNKTSTGGPAAAGREPKARRKRSLKLSPQRLAALKLQGQYMGYLRALKPRQKAQVKAMKTAKGFPPAIALAKKLGR